MMIDPTDPFRFEDRTGHYGAAQADLAPVSPTAAPPRFDPSERPVDPMGASPDQVSGRTFPRDDRDASNVDVVQAGRATGGVVGAEASAQTSVQTSTAFASGDAVPLSAEIAMQVDAATSVARETDDSDGAQTTTFQATGADRVETVVMAPADQTAPQGSGAPVPLLMPPATDDAAATEADFATVATQMNQMMAEMAARIEALSPGGAGRADDAEDDPATSSSTDMFGEAQDRLDALFDGLRGDADETDPGPVTGVTEIDAGMSSDAFADGRARIEDLLADIGPGLASVSGRTSDTPSDPLEGARDRLDALTGEVGVTKRDSTDAEASVPPSLLARLFDGDDAAPGALFSDGDEAEPLHGAGPFVFAPPTFEPGRWDDLPDFG